MADTTEWILRAVFTLIGVGIGYGVRAFQVERENRRRIEIVEEKVDVPRRRRIEDGKITFRGVAPVIALVITLVAVILTANTNSRIDSVSTCSERAITATVTALNERNAANGEQLERQRQLNVEQRRFLTALLPDVNEVAQANLRQYIEALNEAIRAIDKVRQKRLETTYPTEETIRRCVENGGD